MGPMLHSVARIFGLAIVLACGVPVFGQPAPYPALKDVDLTPAIQYLGKYVYTLKQPVYVWNWFNADGRKNQIWNQQFPSNDPVALKHLQSLSRNFWDGYCTRNADLDPAECPKGKPNEFSTVDSYGAGLYVAVDPVISSKFGRIETGQWNLMQVQLPAGLRVVDLTIDAGFLPQEVMAILRPLGCEGNRTRLEGLLQAPHSGYSDRDPDPCDLAIRYIFKEVLKIDAFAYDYVGASIKECREGSHHDAALVIVDGKSLNQTSDVRIFNAHSTDDKVDRARVQSFFYKAVADEDYRSTFYQNYFAIKGIPGHPDFRFWNYRRKFLTHTIEIIACPASAANSATEPANCVHDIPAPVFAQATYPTVMTKSDVPMTLESTQDLLWPDLEGVSADPNLSSWITQNLFHCSRRSDYL
jgi:hypothetical protein